jgi:hypothetical protein
METSSEPDVKIVRNDENWHLPCKMIYTSNPVGIGDNIEKAIKQAFRDNPDYGLIVLGISNRTDFEKFIPTLKGNENIWCGFINQQKAVKFLTQEIQKTYNEICEQAKTRFNKGRENSRFRGILLISPAVCGIHDIPAILTGIALIRRDDLFSISPLQGPEIELSMRLNETAQRILYL